EMMHINMLTSTIRAKSESLQGIPKAPLSIQRRRGRSRGGPFRPEKRCQIADYERNRSSDQDIPGEGDVAEFIYCCAKADDEIGVNWFNALYTVAELEFLAGPTLISSFGWKRYVH